MTNKNVEIICLGDIMPGGVLHCLNSSEQFISEELRRILVSADLRIATLECAIGDEPHFDPVKMGLKQDVIYAPNVDLKKLKELNINCVSLANNHAFDLGAEGLRNTISQLDCLGIQHCGAGMDIEEASRPAEFVIHGRKIGIIAFCDYRDETVGYVPVAGDGCPGMNSLKGNAYVEQIKQYAPKYDSLLVMLHWGVEHSFWPTPSMMKVAENCIKAGASAIIGGHQHRIQPLTHIKGKPVMWGLGNALFPPRFLRAPRPMYYPSPDEDTSRYPVTDSYPWVTEPTYKIWKPLGRIGHIGHLTVNPDNSLSARLGLIQLNDKHVLETAPHSLLSSRDRLEYRTVSFSLKYTPYTVTFNTIKLTKRIARKLISLCR